jgi:hypothetical protein
LTRERPGDKIDRRIKTIAGRHGSAPKGDARVTLLDRLNADMREAMKARDDLKTQALRMVLSDCKYVQVEKAHDLEDADVIQVVKKSIKSREDSESQFRAAGRTDLADKEAEEISILRRYLPQPLTPAELERIVDQAIRETGAFSLKDMGKVMKAVLSVHGSRCDGKDVQKLVTARLNPG